MATLIHQNSPVERNSQQPHCAFCRTPIHNGNDSEEHIIPNAIGGRKIVRNFICRRCNSETGEKWDSALITQLRPLCTLLDIKRHRGKNKAIPVETVNGDELLIYPDGRMTIRHNAFEKSEADGETKLNIQVKSMKDLEKMLPGLLRKHPNLDINQMLGQAKSQRKYFEAPLCIPLRFGGKLAGRSIVKSCLALASRFGFHLDVCEHAHGYLLSNGEPCFGYYNVTDVVVNRPPKVFFHCIYVWR